MVSNIRVSIFNFPYNYKNRVLACFQTRANRCLVSIHWYSVYSLYTCYWVYTLYQHARVLYTVYTCCGVSVIHCLHGVGISCNWGRTLASSGVFNCVGRYKERWIHVLQHFLGKMFSTLIHFLGKCLVFVLLNSLIE